MNNESFETVKAALQVALSLEKPTPENFDFAFYVETLTSIVPSFSEVVSPDTTDVDELKDDCYDFLERNVFSCTDDQALELERIAGRPLV